MADPGLHLDVAAVSLHARMIDDIAAMLDEAATAAAHLDQHDEVYGVLPSGLILPFLNPAQEYAAREIRGGAAATGHIADLLNAMTAEIGITDSEAAAIFRQAGR